MSHSDLKAYTEAVINICSDFWQDKITRQEMERRLRAAISTALEKCEPQTA